MRIEIFLKSQGNNWLSFVQTVKNKKVQFILANPYYLGIKSMKKWASEPWIDVGHIEVKKYHKIAYGRLWMIKNQYFNFSSCERWASDLNGRHRHIRLVAPYHDASPLVWRGENLNQKLSVSWKFCQS